MKGTDTVQRIRQLRNAQCAMRDEKPFNPQGEIRNPKYPLYSKPGFSLVELIISMGILAIGLVAAVRVFPIGLRASRKAEMRSRATMMIQRRLESLKLEKWERLIEGETTVEEDDMTMTTSIYTPQIEGLVDPGRLRVLEVEVQWMQADRPQTMRGLTYIRRPPS